MGKERLLDSVLQWKNIWAHWLENRIFFIGSEFDHLLPLSLTD